MALTYFCFLKVFNAIIWIPWPWYNWGPYNFIESNDDVSQLQLIWCLYHREHTLSYQNSTDIYDLLERFWYVTMYCNSDGLV